mmetsp:Transcript_34700/g.51533  ORF Transcript_34700/g.51533 Transcript_34700/m.51533 type:complete len:514 (-) Transcript_34700:265-1806(-)
MTAAAARRRLPLKSSKSSSSSMAAAAAVPPPSPSAGSNRNRLDKQNSSSSMPSPGISTKQHRAHHRKSRTRRSRHGKSKQQQLQLQQQQQQRDLSTPIVADKAKKPLSTSEKDAKESLSFNVVGELWKLTVGSVSSVFLLLCQCVIGLFQFVWNILVTIYCKTIEPIRTRFIKRGIVAGTSLLFRLFRFIATVISMELLLLGNAVLAMKEHWEVFLLYCSFYCTPSCFSGLTRAIDMPHWMPQMVIFMYLWQCCSLEGDEDDDDDEEDEQENAADEKKEQLSGSNGERAQQAEDKTGDTKQQNQTSPPGTTTTTTTTTRDGRPQSNNRNKKSQQRHSSQRNQTITAADQVAAAAVEDSLQLHRVLLSLTRGLLVQFLIADGFSTELGTVMSLKSRYRLICAYFLNMLRNAHATSALMWSVLAFQLVLAMELGKDGGLGSSSSSDFSAASAGYQSHAGTAHQSPTENLLIDIWIVTSGLCAFRFKTMSSGGATTTAAAAAAATNQRQQRHQKQQ